MYVCVSVGVGVGVGVGGVCVCVSGCGYVCVSVGVGEKRSCKEFTERWVTSHLPLLAAAQSPMPSCQRHARNFPPWSSLS